PPGVAEDAHGAAGAEPLPSERVAVVHEAHVGRVDEGKVRRGQALDEPRRIAAGLRGERSRVFQRGPAEAARRARMVGQGEVERTVERDERRAAKRTGTITERLVEYAQVLAAHLAPAAVEDGGRHERGRGVPREGREAIALRPRRLVPGYPGQALGHTAHDALRRV